MLTKEQGKRFEQFFLGSTPSLLNIALDWIGDNLNPEDVFSTIQLDKWAESEGYIKQDTTI